MTMPENSCDRCDWSEPYVSEAGDVGLECRFNPPQVLHIGQGLTATAYPRLGPDDWCSWWASKGEQLQ